jgi:HPt (histidine-containing phosphotransfer) domain-containing protein
MPKSSKNIEELVIDLSYLRDVASGSTEFMLEMINIFLAHTPDYFEEIKLAIQNKDLNTIVNVAHKIGPTFSFMGVDSIRRNMSEIEHKAIDAENLSEIESIFNDVQSLSVQLFAKLEYIKANL